MILKLSYHLPLFYDTIRSELIKWPRKKENKRYPHEKTRMSLSYLSPPLSHRSIFSVLKHGKARVSFIRVSRRVASGGG
jgi:hypothetical protein